MIDATSKAFLGSTLACAVVTIISSTPTTGDYYSFYGMLQSRQAMRIQYPEPADWPGKNADAIEAATVNLRARR